MLMHQRGYVSIRNQVASNRHGIGNVSVQRPKAIAFSDGTDMWSHEQSLDISAGFFDGQWVRQNSRAGNNAKIAEQNGLK
jgi:hypothetical protein